MKASQRSVLTAAGLVVALAAVGAPAVAGAQRQQIPGPDTKRVLVTTFRGDQEGGVKIADEIRNRITSEFNIKQLMPISKKDIDNTLTQSGYRPDSALSANDILALAKLVRADEVIDGTATKTAGGYRIQARMFLVRADPFFSQPLTNLESRDIGDVTKQVVREYDLSRRQLKETQDCENGIRDRNLPVAMAAARRAIVAYSRATLARLCLASAFQAQKATADSTGPWKDSVIAVTRSIVVMDSVSSIAWQLQFDAYKTRNDTTNMVPALIGYMQSDPGNSQRREQVIAEIINMGRAALAVPIAKQLAADNTGDPTYAKYYYQVLGAAKLYKEAVAAGVAYVALDSSAADSNYYFRQIAYLNADSMYARAAEFAAAGAAKYPRASSFLITQATYERRAGQLPAARATALRARQLDPKSGANLLLAQIYNDLGLADSAIKSVQADIALNPADKERQAQALYNVGLNQYRTASTSKKVDDFQKALTTLQMSDALTPTPTAKFYTGVSAFGIVQVVAANLQGPTKTCADAKLGQDALVIINTKLPGGGSVNPTIAGQILGSVGQFGPFFDGSARRYCR